MSERAKRAKRVVPILILVAAAAAVYAYVDNRRGEKTLILSGTIEARTVNVGSLVGGRVVEVLVDEGDRVAAGQTLATLESDAIDRRIAEQRAAIAASKAALAGAEAGPRREEIAQAAAVAENDEVERRRMSSLLRDGVVARELYDDAATKAKTSAEQLKLLRAGTRREDIDAARARADQEEKRLA